MWEAMTREIEKAGGEVRMNTRVDRLRIEDGRVTGVRAGGGWFEAPHVISSLPLRAIVGMAEPPAPAGLARAARGLRHRRFLAVALRLGGAGLSPDNWIYLHAPAVEV